MLFEADLRAGERAAARYTLTLPRRVPAGTTGARLGQRSGRSLEFQEHRDYRPGDDLRDLDWSAFARSDRLIVKLYREEVAPHLDLVIDGSRSMALAGTAKAQATAGLAALLAGAADRGGFTRTAWLAAEGCERLGTAGGPPSGWRELSFEHRRGLGDALVHLPPAWRRRGLRILISDLFLEADPRHVVSLLAQGAASVTVVQVLARADLDGPARGFGRLEDAETGETRDLLLDDGAVARFRAVFEQHCEAWRRACREAGAVMATVVAEDLVDGWPPAALDELVRQQVLEVG